MENSDQLIFKISSENPKIFPYFARFANFINYMYTQYDNFSMIELFENGFLWIFRDAEHFRQSIQTFRDLRNNAPKSFWKAFSTNLPKISFKRMIFNLMKPLFLLLNLVIISPRI